MQKNFLINYNVKAIPKFEKELKRLSKKYTSLKSEFIELVQSLKVHPDQGTSLANSCCKIRMPLLQKEIERVVAQEVLLASRL